MIPALEQLNRLRTDYPLEKLYTSHPIPGTEEPGYSAIYRNDASPGRLLGTLSPKLTTLHELFQNAVDLFGDSDCLGERKRDKDGRLNNFYTYQSYKEVDRRRVGIASGLIHLVSQNKNYKGPTDKPTFTLSLSGGNKIEMILMDLATRSFSIPNTGLYESLSEEAAHHILKLTDSPVLILDKVLLPKFLSIKKKYNLESLFMIITFEDISTVDPALIEQANGLGIEMTCFADVEKYGSEHRLPTDFNPPTPDTLYTLAFTSGTTGLPKGVYLTHRNATANVTGFIVHCPKPVVGQLGPNMTNFQYNKDQNGNQLRTICFLPLLHNLEKSITNFELSYGIALALPSRPGVQALFDDLPIIQPSLLSGVPRVFTHVENKIKEYIATLPPGSDITQKAREKFGLNNMSYMMCASAPIARESIVFFQKTLKCGFLNGYGATECFSVVSYSDPYQISAGSSGPIGVTSEIRLKDVPEMGYTSKDKPFPRGEVLVRGECTFSHYYKAPEATASAIDSDGWYHSGDVASVGDDGSLYIIDRVKNFFKLAQGEYITPEKVENVYLSQNPLLTQLFVHGDSYQNFLIGIAGVNLEMMKQVLLNKFGFAACEDWTDEDIIHLLKHPKVKAMILNEINANLSSSQLQGYEKLHNLHFELQPLTVENETLTPSFKLKRASAKKVHHEKIQQLYKEGSLVKRSKL